MVVMVLRVRPRQPALFSTPYAAPGGSTIVVADGGDLQTALNNANPGDTITLNAGSTYTGNFTLPAKGGSEYIHVRSSAALTTEGTRITPGQAAGFPKVVTTNASPAIQAAAESSYYRFINCEITSGDTATSNGLVKFGTGIESDPDDLPHHMILDRCYVHGHATNGGRRGVLFSGNYQAVIDSYLSDWKEVGADSQAICGWTGYGPYKIVNNYLEAAGENVMFGGADTAIANLTPSDIEIRGNYFFKPLAWKLGDPSYGGTEWSVKNILELKHAQRVLIQDNIFENCWTHAQSGYAILFTVRNQDGTNPWAVVQDVTYRGNTLRNSDSGMNLLGFDGTHPSGSQQGKRISIYRNLFYDIGDAADEGIMFLVQRGIHDLKIDHNTGIGIGAESAIVFASNEASERFVFTNNLFLHNDYGIIGDGKAVGNATLDFYFPGADVRKNVIVMNAGDYSASYPADNFFPASPGAVGFVNFTGYADLRLTGGSAYHNAALDGTDIGADLATN